MPKKIKENLEYNVVRKKKNLKLLEKKLNTNSNKEQNVHYKLVHKKKRKKNIKK